MKLQHIVLALAVSALAACTSPKHRAPVEERGTLSRPVAVATPPAPAASVPAPGQAIPTQTLPDDAAGRPAAGTYVVKAGDTLIRIGLESGQNWRDIARWSGLENPNALEVGQVLRVTPPEAAPGAAVAQPVAPAPRIESRPLSPGGAVAVGGQAAGTPGTSASPAGSPPTPPVPKDPKEADDGLTWQWPATGAVLRGFDEARSKGLVIGGQAGDPVLAAADGRVVYAGSGLRGYGNLVIVKHNATYLSAYAHNQALLVKEDQVVRRGQKIAEMGSSDADRVQLHFEIRRLGRPVDPARFLPAR